MTVLITGGMGFIGLHTARAFVDAGEDVVITWYQTWREPDFIKDEYGHGVIVEKADVSQAAVIRDLAKKHKVSGIVHLAVPGLGALDAAGDYRVNMDGLIGVLEAAREAEVKRISLASSIGVYHSMGDGPWNETDRVPVESGNPTEAFKKAWEVLALHYATRTGVEVINMRIAGIWGPLYHSGMNLPSRITHAAVEGRDPEYLRGAVPFADDFADICYVKDTGEGIRAVQMADKLEHKIYNVGQGSPTTNGDLEAAVKKVIPDAKISFQAGKGPMHKASAFMATTRLNSELGFKPKYDIDSGFADYIDWLRAGNEH
jgi:UDP-glucose 4-epimerase